MTSDNSIIVGSRVVLKSGGPTMTVSEFKKKKDGDIYNIGIAISLLNRNNDISNPYVVCEWFDGGSKKHKVILKEMLNMIK